jgi:hypothetical protein
VQHPNHGEMTVILLKQYFLFILACSMSESQLQYKELMRLTRLDDARVRVHTVTSVGAGSFGHRGGERFAD